MRSRHCGERLTADHRLSGRPISLAAEHAMSRCGWPSYETISTAMKRGTWCRRTTPPLAPAGNLRRSFAMSSKPAGTCHPIHLYSDIEQLLSLLGTPEEVEVDIAELERRTASA